MENIQRNRFTQITTRERKKVIHTCEFNTNKNQKKMK